MDYEAELDAQIEVLSKRLQEVRRVKQFWDEKLGGKDLDDRLYKKWRPMLEHMHNEDNRKTVARNLEIISILIDNLPIIDSDGVVDTGMIKRNLIPLLARADSKGNSYK